MFEDPFTGSSVPIYRMNGTRLQERRYPLTGVKAPIYRAVIKLINYSINSIS